MILLPVAQGRTVAVNPDHVVSVDPGRKSRLLRGPYLVDEWPEPFAIVTLTSLTVVYVKEPFLDVVERLSSPTHH